MNKTWAWGAMVVSLMSAGGCTAKQVLTGGVGGFGGFGGAGNSSSVTHVSASHSSSGAGTGGATGCGSFQFSTDANCEACIEGSCCTELAACDTGTPCNDLFTCLGNCATGDMACQMGCQTTQAAGLNDAKALDTCYMNSCASDMACTSGQICMSGVTTNNAMCDACGTTSCCTEWTACTDDPTCNGCVGMSTAACKANTLLTAAEMCLKNKCASACPQGFCDSGVTSGVAACDTCGGNKCCNEWKACVADTGCEACLHPNPPASCSTNTILKAANACLTTNCMTECM